MTAGPAVADCACTQPHGRVNSASAILTVHLPPSLTAIVSTLGPRASAPPRCSGGEESCFHVPSQQGRGYRDLSVGWLTAFNVPVAPEQLRHGSCCHTEKKRCGSNFAVLLSHGSLTPCQPVPSLTLQSQAPDRVATAVLSRTRLLVGWLLNVPATCECISGTDLHRQFYVLPH